VIKAKRGGALPPGDDRQSRETASVFARLIKDPAPYVARSGWPTWAVLPVGVVIFLLAVIVGVILAGAHALISGATLPASVDPLHPPPAIMQGIIIGFAGFQIGLVGLVWLAAGFFGARRSEVLALKPPVPSWWVLLLALVPLFVGTSLWEGFLLWWKPDVLQTDMRVFQEMLRGDNAWIAFLVIAIGAPFSEEFLFRGFLFSGLAKRLSFVLTAVLTSLLWTSLHYGYSIYLLAEVFAIGLYFSWLLVRTDSLWVTIFCHAVNNTAGVLLLLYLR
jgi:membrane protease YdiL (CAAX protease family)